MSQTAREPELRHAEANRQTSARLTARSEKPAPHARAHRPQRERTRGRREQTPPSSLGQSTCAAYESDRTLSEVKICPENHLNEVSAVLQETPLGGFFMTFLNIFPTVL